MNIKRKSSFFLILLVIVSMIAMGCSNENTPQAKVDKLFTSAKRLDIKSMEEVLEVDPEKVLEEELDKNIDEDYEEFDRGDYIRMAKDLEGLKDAVSTIKKYQNRLDYEILEVIEEEDQATVIVDANYVDASVIGKKTLSTVMSRIFSDSISDIFAGSFSEESSIEDIDKEEELKKYMQIALDSFNESANSYEISMTSNVFEIKLKKDESGEWLISGEESDMVLFSALFFNFIDLELIDHYIDEFS